MSMNQALQEINGPKNRIDSSERKKYKWSKWVKILFNIIRQEGSCKLKLVLDSVSTHQQENRWQQVLKKEEYLKHLLGEETQATTMKICMMFL